MDQDIKEALLNQLSSFLDGLDDSASGKSEIPLDEGDEATDLFAIFVEIAALRNETRAQSRLTKDALDQFRAMFDTLRSNNATLEQELKEARARAREQSRETLKPLLLEILEVRDRLAAGVASSSTRVAQPWWERWLGKQAAPDPWREGMIMILRRLDQALAERRVMPMTMAGRPFQPAYAYAVSAVEDTNVADGIVLAELRTGFMWEEDVLRLAEVTVAKHSKGSVDPQPLRVAGSV